MAEAQKTLPLTETPEFKAMLAEEVKKVLVGLKGELGSDLSQENRRFAENLAMAFATLSEQGTGRKYVAPEILRARTEARELMKDLIMQARRNGQVPSYRVIAKTLLDDQVVEPFWVDSSHVAQHTEIDWPGVPNDAMQPINEVAKGIYQAFLDSIGSKAQSVSASGAVLDVPDAMQDGFGTTRNGLVVRGGAVPRRNRPGEASPPEHQEGLSLHHRNKPGRTVETRVLGSVAEPARQTV